MSGWIKLHRKMTEWEWYDDGNTMRLFLHCLLKANHEDKAWRGKVIKRGTFITSIDKLSKELGLTVKQIRVAMTKLKGTNEVANKSTPQHTVITVINYDNYQLEGKQKGKQKGKPEDKQRATTKNVKKFKEEITSKTFDEFWLIWPYKKAKADAMKAWKKMSAENRNAAFDGSRNFWSSKKPDYYINPATYLNGARWEDECEDQQVSIEGWE